MAKITRTEEQLTKDLEVAIKKLYKTLPGTPEEKNQILREKFEGVINQLKSKDVQMVNSSKKTRTLQEDFAIDSETTAVQQDKVKTKTRISAEDRSRIIELAKQGVPQTKIASRVKRHEITVHKILRKKGIMPVVKIRALLKEQEYQEMSAEELADRTGVYPETIRRIREKLGETENIFQENITAVGAKTLPIPEGVSQRSGEPKEEVLPEKQDDQQTELTIQLTGIEQQIVNYGKAGMKISEIIEKTNATEEAINSIFNQNHIWSSEKIREKLRQPGTEKISNAVWAKWTGVNEETIAAIREELEKDKQSEGQREAVAIIKTSEETGGASSAEVQKDQEAQNETLMQPTNKDLQMVLYGRMAMEVAEISEKVGVSKGSVSKKLRLVNIWSAAKIRSELKQPGAEKRSDDWWANQAGVDIEAIRRIREEIRNEAVQDSEEIENSEVYQERANTSKNSKSYRERLSVSRSGRVQIIRETDDEKTRAAEASPVITYQAKAQEYPKNEQELAAKLGISVGLVRTIKSKLSKFPAVAGIANEHMVSRTVVEDILEVVKKEQYDRTHTEVQYKMKMNELRTVVGREVKSSTAATVLESKVDILINEFASFLTQNDYSFLAYGYAKAKSYVKAIQVGEEHLGLDTPSVSALEQRIQELLQKGLDEKGKQEVARTFDMWGKENRDER